MRATGAAQTTPYRPRRRAMNRNAQGKVGVEAVAAIAIGTAVMATGVWVCTRTPKPVDEAFEAIVADVSPTAAPTSLCSDLERVASRALRDHRGVVHLTLYATGDRASG